MKAKRQQFKDKQLKGFVSELETLFKKYGIYFSVPGEDIKYGMIKELKLKIGEDYGTKIYNKILEYEPIKFDVNKRYNLKPSGNYGFYMFAERELNDPIKTLKRWELVHSIITQISGIDPVVVRDYLDDMGYQKFRWIFREDEDAQIKNMTRIYINSIDYSLTQYLNSYNERMGLE